MELKSYKMGKPIQDCLIIIQSAKTDINKKLTGTENVHALLEINSLLDRLITRFEYMGGVVEPESVKGKVVDQFPPITNFMGQEIERTEPIKKDDLTPKEAQKNKFREDVKKLYGEIRNKTPEQVLNEFTIPEHVLIVRGVAKQAGVEDYQSREMNIAFIEEIQFAIQELEEADSKLQKINTAAGETKRELTEEDLLDPEIKKLKAAVGDTLVIDAQGKKSIIKETK